MIRDALLKVSEKYISIMLKECLDDKEKIVRYILVIKSSNHLSLYIKTLIFCL